MIRTRRSHHLAAACGTALLLLSTACGGGGTGSKASGGSTSAGKPVPGGSGRVLALSEPVSLDPALMGNEWVINAFVGNSLYGTLMINDTTTGAVRYKMAQSFVTKDGGTTFELKLRPGLKFSDGTPLDAEAVKFNWDRTRNPETGAISRAEASLIASTTVVDATTLKVRLVQPIPQFAQAVITTSLNWMASPEALRAGRKAYDAKPAGAGPYTLTKWTRQDSMALAKNPGFYQKSKPYLDTLTVRTAPDAKQRLDTMTSGGADVSIESNWQNLSKAEAAGLSTTVVPLNGGQALTMNMRRAPFDDLRARRAIAAAIDLKAMNQTVYNGTGKESVTLFEKTSPFYQDIPLSTYDKAKAQRLFDELAADGKPLSFTFKTFPTTENRTMAESVQTQLSQYKNVKVSIKVIDFADNAALHAKHDYEMVVSSAHFIDPETRLYSAYYGASLMNMPGIADKQLDAALVKGRASTDQSEREAAYKVAQERLAALVPAVFMTRPAPSAVAGKNVHGLVEYGGGSLLPEEIWIRR